MSLSVSSLWLKGFLPALISVQHVRLHASLSVSGLQCTLLTSRPNCNACKRRDGVKKAQVSVGRETEGHDEANTSRERIYDGMLMSGSLY